MLKHRISSINGESARYKELKEDKFYVPTEFYNLGYDESNISYSTQHLFRKIDTWGGVLEEFTNISNELYHECLTQLTPVLGRKRAKESARYFKTYNSQIEADIMFNMRSFHNFITQRMDSHSQLEIRVIAKEMLDILKNIEGNPFQYTFAAWGV